MENKNFDWKKFWWRTIQTIIVLFMNGAGIAWFVLKFYGNGEVETPIGSVEYSMWDVLELRYRLLIGLFALIGLIGSVAWSFWLYKRSSEEKKIARAEDRADKRAKEQAKFLKDVMKGV